jgi:hypothetical protein
MIRWRRIAATVEQDAATWRSPEVWENFERNSQVLKAEGGRSVRRGRMLGQDVIVKEWRMPRFGPDALKSRMRVSEPWRHRRAAGRLLVAGIPTARVLALLQGDDGSSRIERLLLEALPGRTLLHLMADLSLPPRTQHALAVAAGELAATMVGNRLFNRDNKPSNLIVTILEPGPRLAIVDCAGVRKLTRSTGKLERMLASLVLEPRACGCLPRRTLMMRAALGAAGGDRGRARTLFRRIAVQVAGHRGPGPRTNPLWRET